MPLAERAHEVIGPGEPAAFAPMTNSSGGSSARPVSSTHSRTAGPTSTSRSTAAYKAAPPFWQDAPRRSLDAFWTPSSASRTAVPRWSSCGRPAEEPGWSCHAEQKTDILTDDELERLVATTKGGSYENRRDAAVLWVQLGPVHHGQR